jgi:hypothetical protein
MPKKLPRTWEPNGPEETLLKRIWPDHTIQEVVEQFKKAGYRDRSRTGIERKSRALSLRKTEEGRRKSYVGRQFADVSALEKLDWLPTFDKFHTVHSECATVYSDPHIPYVDMGLARKMCAISKKMKCTDLILGGDTFNQDMFSHFIRYLGAEKGELDASWSFELEAVSEFLKMVLDTFQHVWVTRGNHDERIRTPSKADRPLEGGLSTVWWTTSLMGSSGFDSPSAVTVGASPMRTTRAHTHGP